MEERDRVETESVPCGGGVADSEVREGIDGSGEASYGIGASLGGRAVDMYNGRSAGVDCSSEVSSSLPSFSNTASTAAASIRLPSLRRVRRDTEVQASRSVFHANTRTRTMNVR